MKKTATILALALAAAFPCHSQDAAIDNSILQAEMEAQLPTGMAGWMQGDYMTGDWWGYRTKLRESGVDYFGFLNFILNGNPVGGIDSNHATFVSDAYMGLRFDLEKLFGWKGGQFVVSGINREGPALDEYVGATYSVQQMVGGQRLFLYQVFLKQQFTESLSLKIGRYGASDDFNTSPFYGYNLNNGITGDIRNVLFDTRFSAYPFAVWAASLFYETDDFFVKAGIFQTSERMFENDDHGVNWSIKGEDGFTAHWEIGWTPELFKRPVPTGETTYDKDGKATVAPTVMKGMPGHYWIGGTYSKWDYYERFGGGFQDHSYGFYANADQMVYQEIPGGTEGLYAFLAAGYYPQSAISIIPFQVNAGLHYRGLIPGRNEDRTLLSFIYGDFSDDYATATQIPGGSRAKSEKVIEAGYRIQITPWAYIQPDAQYVIDPGGTGDIDNALVVGFQAGVTF